ncbi:hypothetical protein ABMA27_008306 [Loxostege sticticalis]|uniref:C2H2-type domain-containing protein n=1 Tax=Loxostege sticticalis TaxID=481309 RepID=A0ABR3HAT5_LOXSC
MELDNTFIETLKLFGVGRRKLDDDLFAKDKPPPRLGVYDLDEENLCHDIVETACTVPGCKFTAESLLDYENHYNASHRYACSQCKKMMPSPHLLDLHIQESHDSFFAVMAERKPSYCCYIEECKEKFKTTDERLDHCVKIHKLPKDFRFEQKHKKAKKTKQKKTNDIVAMELDGQSVKLDAQNSKSDQKKFSFTNSRQKGFAKYTGRKFTTNEENQTPRDVNIDEVMEELKTNLPE